MATEEGIRSLFRVLEAAGYQRPKAWSSSSTEVAAERLKAGVTIWTKLALDAPDQAIQAALVVWMRRDTSGFWPTPGVVIAIVDELVTANRLDAEAAWGHALAMMRRFGSRRLPSITADNTGDPRLATQFQIHPDEATARAMLAAIDALGGWRALGSAEDNETAANRASFRTAYQAAMKRRDLGALTSQVEGLIEAGGPFKALGDSLPRRERK